MILDQSLKALHDGRSECHGAIVIQFSYLCILGYRNNYGHLIKGCGDSRLGQGEIEYVCKHTSQLVCACSEDAARDAVQAGSLARVNMFKYQTHLGQSPQSLVAGRVGGTVLSSKVKAEKVLSLSGSKTLVFATWLVFLLQSVIVCRPCHICLVSEPLNCYSTLSLTFDCLRWLIQRLLPLPRFGSPVQIIMAFVVL